MIVPHERRSVLMPPPLARLSAARISAGDPLVTVVIPVFNKWQVTERCLRSLFVCDRDIAIQVVVVDDGSNDETSAELGRLPGVEALRNGDNRGFVVSCNRGAALARGQFLYFLNNDTELHDGAMRALVRRMSRSEKIGIVGSKLIYPNGRLQEAGNIIWSDASGWNYGRNDAPQKFEYNFARDVDYVSGASLFVRTELFRDIGGFDVRFSPGYYEDTDLCFAVRARGGRVVYEPASVVVHYEGLTSGTDLSAGMKRFQAINRAKFQSKWEAVLASDHLLSHPKHVFRAARLRNGSPTLLIVDSYVPLYDRESGSNRLKRLLNGFHEAGVRVVFLPDNLAPMTPYTQQLQNEGVEVIYHVDDHRRPWRELLGEALPTVDAAWVCRPDLFCKYAPFVRQASSIPVLYDTIDLHYLRLRRQAESEAASDVVWKKMERLELACAHAADRTIVVSKNEASLLEAAGISNVAVVPNVHDVEMSRTLGFAQTSGLLFIGGYNHTPNVDAARWLVRDIMPFVWSRLPDLTVTLLGSNPPESVCDLASDRVTVPGFVTDHEVALAFRSARLFVAPLRYGAGLKGKIGQALGFGTPIVSTPVGVEGFGLRHGDHVLVADDAPAFADAIVRLYLDAELWHTLSAASSAALEPFGSDRVVADAVALVRAATTVVERPAVRNGKTSSGTTGVFPHRDDQVRTGAELQRIRRREAETYLLLQTASADVCHLTGEVERLEARGAEEQRTIERLNVEIERRNAAYATLLTVVSTLRAALTESVEREARVRTQAEQRPASGRRFRLAASGALRRAASAVRRLQG